jgi:hypothetical protein
MINGGLFQIEFGRNERKVVFDVAVLNGGIHQHVPESKEQEQNGENGRRGTQTGMRVRNIRATGLQQQQ